MGNIRDPKPCRITESGSGSVLFKFEGNVFYKVVEKIADLTVHEPF